MKHSVKKFLLAVLAVVFVFLSVSDSFAQTYEESVAYRNYLEQYYRNKTLEEMWRDYVDLVLRQDGSLAFLAGRASTFKEPFKSWAVDELLHLDLNSLQLADFLAGDFTEKAKGSAFKGFLNLQPPYENTKISSPYLERLCGLVGLLSSREGTIIYREYLIAHILSHPEVVYLSNEHLVPILSLGSFEQKIRIANIVLNNNPGRWELDIIAASKIDTHSDMASYMLLLLENDGSMEKINSDWLMRVFLAEKMDK